MEMKNDAFITELRKEFREKQPEICEKHLEKTAGMVKTIYTSRQNSLSRTRRIGFGELVLRQVRFIGWKIWCLQLLALVGRFLSSSYYFREYGSGLQASALSSICDGCDAGVDGSSDDGKKVSVTGCQRSRVPRCSPQDG